LPAFRDFAIPTRAGEVAWWTGGLLGFPFRPKRGRTAGALGREWEVGIFFLWDGWMVCCRGDQLENAGKSIAWFRADSRWLRRRWGGGVAPFKAAAEEKTWSKTRHELASPSTAARFRGRAPGPSKPPLVGLEPSVASNPVIAKDRGAATPQTSQVILTVGGRLAGCGEVLSRAQAKGRSPSGLREALADLRRRINQGGWWSGEGAGQVRPESTLRDGRLRSNLGLGPGHGRACGAGSSGRGTIDGAGNLRSSSAPWRYRPRGSGPDGRPDFVG